MIIFIYALVFLTEFSFFFALPVLGNSEVMDAKSVSLCFAGAVIIESIMLFAFTGYFDSFSRKKIICTSLLMRAVAFGVIIYVDEPISWYIFFVIIALSKFSKPFTRELLTETMSGNKLKSALNYFSFSQNFAVVIAPVISVFSIENDKILIIFNLILIFNLLFGFLSVILIYDFPNFNKMSKNHNCFSFRLFGEFKNVLGDKNIFKLLVSSFFCFLVMGCFITATTIVSDIRKDLSGFAGIFFSIVGVSICVWQGLFAKLIKFSDINKIRFLFFVGMGASFYLNGGVYISILALIFYSIYESIIIPEIYYKSSTSCGNTSSSLVFSYIMIFANVGEAFGAWLTGSIVSFDSDFKAIHLSVLIGVSVIISVWSLSSVKKYGEKIDG